MLLDTNNPLVGADDKLTTLIGPADLVVISTKEAMLIANREIVQVARITAGKLNEKERIEWELTREVYRPRGQEHSMEYQSAMNGTVKPGAKLSL